MSTLGGYPVFSTQQEDEDSVLTDSRPFYSMCPLPVMAGLPSPARVQLLPDTYSKVKP